MLFWVAAEILEVACKAGCFKEYRDIKSGFLLINLLWLRFVSRRLTCDEYEQFAFALKMDWTGRPYVTQRLGPTCALENVSCPS